MTTETEQITITIKEHSSVPKYIQVADSFIADIETGKIKMGQRMPSINELSDCKSSAKSGLI